MIVTVASFKGGQAKTTAAIQIAALLNEKAPALLVDIYILKADQTMIESFDRIVNNQPSGH